MAAAVEEARALLAELVVYCTNAGIDADVQIERATIAIDEAFAQANGGRESFAQAGVSRSCLPC
jgi:hypothetical protein